MRRCRGLGRPILLAALGLLAAAARAGGEASLPDGARIHGWVRELSDPAMEGRASGAPGGARAAAYLADHFARIGLVPAGDDGGYLQAFDVVTGMRLGERNALEVAAGAPARQFVVGADFLPFPFSDDGTVSAEVVFAGYGISAPPVGYDDYAGLDVRGKVVLAMTGEPREQDPQGPFRHADHFHYTELRHKALNAREHGAVGVILVEAPGRADDAPRPIRGTSPPWGIVAVSATRAVAQALLDPAGLDLAALGAEIDRALAPRSRPLPGVTVRLRVALVRERGRAANVVGVLPGTDPVLREEAVVIGGHYDHLGHGSPFSLSPSEPDAIHPGADDNASGTALVVALAEGFARAGGARRSLVFAAFAGEEMGLLGSSHYGEKPPVPLAQTAAMVNLDSVGRLRERRLYVMGVESGHGLRALVEGAAQGLDLDLALRGDGVGSSDHTAFYTRDVPVLFFFTGTHEDYHRPSDTADKVSPDGLRTVAAMTYRTVRALADRDPRPTFTRVAGGAPRERDRGYGPYFGSVPDFAERTEPGVRLGGVRPGSPAERAGLRGGDVIVRFAGVTVRTLDDLVFALRTRRAGDAVEVVYLRDGTEHAVDATLEPRR